MPYVGWCDHAPLPDANLVIEATAPLPPQHCRRGQRADVLTADSVRITGDEAELARFTASPEPSDLVTPQVRDALGDQHHPQHANVGGLIDCRRFILST